MAGSDVDAAWRQAFDGSDGSGEDYGVSEDGTRPDELWDSYTARETESTDAADTAGLDLDTSHGRGGVATGREDCGFPGISEAECIEARDCQWDDTQFNVPWCFSSL